MIHRMNMNKISTLFKDYSKIGLQRAILIKPLILKQSIPVVTYFTTNWGDAIGRHIVSMLSHRPTHMIDINVYNEHYKLGIGNSLNNKKLVATVGSIIQKLPSGTIVWGSGIISEHGKPPENLDVRAVRGPLTRDVLLKNGIDCPEVYGDPALLLPKLLDISPPKNKKYKLGCILHYIHDNTEMRNTISAKCEPHFISIRKGLRSFLEELADCEYILSSSLHGLIASDSLNIPSLRLKVKNSNDLDDFKFNDYSASCNECINFIELDSIKTQGDLINQMPGNARKIDINPLLEAQPWDDL